MENLLLPYGKSFDEKTVEWLNSSGMRDTFGLTYRVTVESHRQWLDTQKNYHIWAIVVPDGVHIGNAILIENTRHNKAVLEIYIGQPEYQGKGFGKEAMDELLDKAFNELQLNRVQLVTRPGNTAAEKLYQQCGFRIEGREKQAIKTDQGYADQVLWAILSEQWRSERDC